MWATPGLTRRINKNAKSSKNNPILALICWCSIPCVFCVYMYTLLKVVSVSHYYLSVHSMSVWIERWVGPPGGRTGWVHWVGAPGRCTGSSELYPVFVWIFGI